MPGLLDSINSPHDLRKLRKDELPQLAAEIRQAILDVVSETGGHLASSLGAVELAIALHYVLDTPKDKLIWDVGHQAYAHKILTGRNRAFKTLRQLGGISGFPNKDESEYDVFTVGHSSTSISSALGLAVSRDLRGSAEKIVAVVGDAALAGGMSLEALNHAGHLKKDIIVILNDNEHSIAKTVGALSRYLNNIILNPMYNKIRTDLERVVKRVPRFGLGVYRAARKFEEGLKNLLVPGIIFEELGFRYFGPIDGHSTDELIGKLTKIIAMKGPIIVHTITKKGKGFKFSEDAPSDFHGSCPFDKVTGKDKPGNGAKHTYTSAFSEKMVQLGEKRSDIVAVSAAMLCGTGLDKFGERFPDRIFDVGIAEEHAVTFAAGLARGGLKPFVAVYSTFLQRAYDQILHDVCLQGLGVVLCLDRAGIVGEDGATHNGMFDIAYLRQMPGMIVAAPKDFKELQAMLELAAALGRPFSVRYPRGGQLFGFDEEMPALPLEVGRAEILADGRHVAIIAIGSMVSVCLQASRILSKAGISAAVVNARFAKPLDSVMLGELSYRFKKIVTVEEGVMSGGFGSGVLEFLDAQKMRNAQVKLIGLPDEFIEHGKREELMRKYNLTPQGIADVIIGEQWYK